MNWLAHILLAGPDPELQLGGVLADMLSMPQARTMPPGIQQGIALHQRIDAFADAHPAVSVSNRRLVNAGVGLRPAAAGIAVDMLYDHLLARDWPLYCSETPLPAFADRFYQVAAACAAPIPSKVRFGLDLMRSEDWLTSYRDLAEIRAVLGRIRRRLSPRAAAVSPLPVAADVFARDPVGFEEDFSLFWPEISSRTGSLLSLEALTPAKEKLS